jgi:hypothetical protein
VMERLFLYSAMWAFGGALLIASICIL